MPRKTREERLQTINELEKRLLADLDAKKKAAIEAQKEAERKIREKVKQLDAKRRSLTMLETKVRRKYETQRKIILGGILLKYLNEKYINITTGPDPLREYIRAQLKVNERALKNPLIIELMSRNFES